MVNYYFNFNVSCQYDDEEKRVHYIVTQNDKLIYSGFDPFEMRLNMDNEVDKIKVRCDNDY